MSLNGTILYAPEPQSSRARASKRSRVAAKPNVCKRLVEALGGTMTIKSKVGKGSAFTVEMPAKEKPGVT